MKLPGRAWLRFEARESQDGTTHLEQSAAFIPKGLPGLINAVARRAERM